MSIRKNLLKIIDTYNHENQKYYKGGFKKFKKDNPIDEWYKKPFKKIIWKYKYRKLIKSVQKQKSPIAKNVYSSYEGIGDFHKKFDFFHYFFKYKLFVPALRIAEFILKKYIEKEIPDDPQFKNMRVIDRAIDKTFITWHRYYRKGCSGSDKNRTDEEILKQYQDHPRMVAYKLQRAASMIDSAYMEFDNIFAFCLMEEMQKEYENHKIIRHLLYHSRSMFNVNYFIAQSVLCKEIKNHHNVCVYKTIPQKSMYNYERIELIKINDD